MSSVPAGSVTVYDENFLARRALAGGALLLLALLFWMLRDVVPSWAAKRVTATADLDTTTERDDTRVYRAFAAARRGIAADASLEPLPNSTKVRHTQLSVRAGSEREAVAHVRALSDAMVAEFAKEGEGILGVYVHGRAHPVPDATTVLLGRTLRLGALAAALLGLALAAGSLRGFQAGPKRQPPVFWLVIGGGLTVALVPILLPGKAIAALMIMAIPGLIAGAIVYKMAEVRHAAVWPSTSGRITRSEVRAERHRTPDGIKSVVNRPAIEYEFALGGRTIHGTRIGIGDNPPVEQTLDRYPVGATVPVYYNPANPEEAVLERDTPVEPMWMYTIAAGVLLAGIAAVGVFLNLDRLMEKVSTYLPAGAMPQFTIFFGLAGAVLLLILWASRRQVAEAARWPRTGGRIVSSNVESYRVWDPGTRSSKMTLYQPVVEYSYEVDRRPYHSTQLSFGGKVGTPERLAAAKAARYQPDTPVEVRYDPKNPSNAVLEVKVALGWPLLAVAVAFFGAAVFFSRAFH